MIFGHVAQRTRLQILAGLTAASLLLSACGAEATPPPGAGAAPGTTPAAAPTNTPLIAGSGSTLLNGAGVTLPDTDIAVVHRSDGSGTTYIFASYLSAVSPDWQGKVGKGTAVNWPVGLGGKGNAGVAALVKQTPGSIGYVELAYAIQNTI